MQRTRYTEQQLFSPRDSQNLFDKNDQVSCYDIWVEHPLTHLKSDFLSVVSGGT